MENEIIGDEEEPETLEKKIYDKCVKDAINEMVDYAYSNGYDDYGTSDPWKSFNVKEYLKKKFGEDIDDE